MTAETNHLLEHFQVRKNTAQKAAFREWITGVLTAAGYTPRTESGRTLVQNHNVVVGDPEKAAVVFTAHYDTCSVLPFPNLITPRNVFLYFLYQLVFFVPIFALAVGAEALLLILWKDCPLWLAIAVVYLVCGFCIWWILAGPANQHTANDNTSGVATLLEIALALPAEDRDKAAFVFFDNEEKGLLGSTQFKKAHRKGMADTLVVNFDCVSDGDYIHFYPNKMLKRNEAALARLEQAFLSDDLKTVEVIRGFGYYPSDQKHFPLGVGVAALRKGPLGYWLGRIHTCRDTVFQTENIELLCRGALALITALKV